MTHTTGVEPLHWIPGGGIVAPVHPDLIPCVPLPAEATRIQIDSNPAYHVTVIKRRALEHCGQAMADTWPGILADPPKLPAAKPHNRVIEAGDPASGTRVWIVELCNAEAFDVLRLDLTHRLEQAFAATGYPALKIGDNPVRWHITIANNCGGNPFNSFGDPHRYINQGRSVE
jgi:hypothetical protein